MSKNKKSQNPQQLSPAQYVRTKARNLPVAECYINEGWEAEGLANIIVARAHKSGNFTIGIYLVDVFCLGVKNTLYRFNISREELDDFIEGFHNISISYNEAHNIIFGALEYAEDLGIAPHKDFALTQYILEEDTDEIPLIEYEFGKNGKPFLVAHNMLELNRYRSTLEKSTNGDFHFLVTDDYDTLADGNYDSLPHTKYNYQYPEYPKELKLTHEELKPLFLAENNDRLQEKTIRQILALPRETLINDLRRCILYTIGQFLADGQLVEDNVYGVLAHCLFLLGELRATESLGEVLEIMRQDEEFVEFYFGDYAEKFLVLTLYYIAENQLTALLSYVKEPGLYIYVKAYLLTAVSLIALKQPERRAEIIDWFREILKFYYEKIDDTAYFDATFVGFITSELIDIQATELLPEIEKLYATGLVDEMCCGDYKTVVCEMLSVDFHSHNNFELLNIYERYDNLVEFLK